VPLYAGGCVTSVETSSGSRRSSTLRAVRRLKPEALTDSDGSRRWLLRARRTRSLPDPDRFGPVLDLIWRRAAEGEVVVGFDF
jgi:hypothetical protein